MSTIRPTSDATSDATSPGLLRPLLWVLLVASAVANAVVSLTGAPLPVHVVLQTTTAVTGLTLLALFLWRRR